MRSCRGRAVPCSCGVPTCPATDRRCMGLSFRRLMRSSVFSPERMYYVFLSVVGGSAAGSRVRAWIVADAVAGVCPVLPCPGAGFREPTRHRANLSAARSSSLSQNSDPGRRATTGHPPAKLKTLYEMLCTEKKRERKGKEKQAATSTSTAMAWHGTP
jgi:hypothetical protein